MTRRRPVLAGKAAAERGKWLAPVRKKALEMLRAGNGTRIVAKALDLKPSTVRTWKRRVGLVVPRKFKRREPLRIIAPPSQTPTPTFDQILQAVPDSTTLGTLLLEGFVRRIESLTARVNELDSLEEAFKNESSRTKTLDAELNAALEANKRLSGEVATLREKYNSRLLKTKGLTSITIDQVRHVFTPKGR